MRHHSFALYPVLQRLALLSAALIAAGCSGSDEQKVEGDRGYDVERYAISGEFDWSARRLAVREEITLTSTEAGLTEIQLDSAVTVHAVRVAGASGASTKNAPFEADAARGKLVVSLDGAMAAGETMKLEIDYEAEASDALSAIPARAGDPVAVRALFTHSEPLGAAAWMPCNNTPADRAIFSVEMRMDGAETMIANGSVVSDEKDGASGRRMKYETGYTLPPYLMAFAISDFEVETAMKGDLPVSVWHRRGLPGSHDAMAKELARMIDHFETLLAPYPFEKYALVLLPSFPAGGMENASISFQREASSTEPSLSGDLTLAAHELGHQWFGDLVTLASWDDLWIKEGMATLLEYEGARVYIDENGKGTLNGDNFYPDDGVPIRDKAALPDDKYTSGAYSRAAWLLTQIRGLVGEDAFWGTLRKILDEHRFGTIGTDAFIDAFAPALGPDATARVRRAVDAKALPTLTVTSVATDGAAVTLHDPDGALISPIEVAFMAASGSLRTEVFTEGKVVPLVPQPDDEFLILDPLDRHPDLSIFMADDASANEYQQRLSPLRVPRSSQGTAHFLDIAGTHQLAAVYDHLPDITPTELSGFVSGLDAETARAVSLMSACGVALSVKDTDPTLYDTWKDTLKDALSATAYSFGLPYVYTYAACGDVVGADTLFGADWDAMKSGLSAGGVSDARLSYLSKFKLSPSFELDAWGSVAQKAASPRARRIAAQHLYSYARALDPADMPAFRAFFIDQLFATEVDDVLQMLIRGAVATMASTAADNQKAIDGLREVLGKEVTWQVHAQAVCAAYRLTQGDQAAFAVFGASLQNAKLTARAKALLADPSGCN